MNNNRGSADIDLNVFGGLCAEIAPSDLPEGASPLNYDVDYDIGSVYTRSGLTPVYSYQNSSVGPTPGRFQQIPVNGLEWTVEPESILVTWPNGKSPIAWWNNFGLYLPAAITGIEVAITGHYAGPGNPAGVVRLTTSAKGKGVGAEKYFYFQTSDSTVILGGPDDTWMSGIDMVAAGHPNFGVLVYGVAPCETATLGISSLTVKFYLAQKPANVNYIKTFIEDDQHTHTFVLDSAGVLWEEDVTDDPGILALRTDVIPPNTFAQSCTNLNEEWIAFSDLKKGTAIPRHGTNLDRISQVGPGVGPQVVGMAGTGPNATTWQVCGITQNPPHTGVYDVLWSAGPGFTTPGNVLTIFYAPSGPNVDPALVQALNLGGAVNLSGMQNIPGGVFAGLNGTYKITSASFGIPPGAGHNYWFFTVQTQAQSPSQNNNFGANDNPNNAPMTWQLTMATLTTCTPANIQVGQHISIQNTNSGFDGTWTVLAAQNGGQYTVTETSLTNGIATYTFVPIAGVLNLPTVGELVTVNGSTNGPVDPNTKASIFDVVNAPITAVSGDSFSVAITGQANVPAAVEVSASAIISGTVYLFDPGLTFLVGTAGMGTVTGIFSNVGPGGNVTIGGLIGAGIRQAVTIFQTRNGYLTAPSPPVYFETTVDASSLQVSNIAIGPPDVIARIIGFTPAGGGFFFYIPEPVTITGIGQAQTYTSTVVNDNISTSATFSFPDSVLMAATSIDTQGNDLFNQLEIGSSGAIVPYAGRNFYIMQNNKVQNFLNLSFDGGTFTTPPSGIPLGWHADANQNASGGTIRNSPIFGFSYYISN